MGDASRPTCKVVQRPGEAGARAHPRGCKIRSTVQPGGQVKSSTAAGVQKQKAKTTRLKYTLTATKNNHSVRMLLDTGAVVATCKQGDVARWGLGAPSAIRPLRVASGQTIQVPVHTAVPFSVRINGRSYPVTSTLYVTAGERLCGTNMIRQLPGVSLKFVK